MRSILTLIAIIAITFSGFSTGDESEKKDKSNNKSISGVVVDKNTGETLVGAIITIDGQHVIKTDLEGKFIFTNLEPGTHKISVNYISYKEKVKEIDLTETREEVEIALEIID